MSVVSALSSGLSGLYAGGAIIANAGANVANLGSAGYRASRVNLAGGPGGGVAAGVSVASVTRDASPGPIDPDGQTLSNVDPVQQAVAATQGKVLFDASARLVKTADQMLGTLLDVTSRG